MNILLIGATSSIAQASARCFAASGASFFLVARSHDKVSIVADDLRVRGAARVETFVLDIDRVERYQAMIEAAYQAYSRFDVVYMAHGVLTKQVEASENAEVTRACMHANATSITTLIATLMPRLKQAKGSCLAVISSVAGDRGRASMYTYSAAKAALNVFLQGVRGELLPYGVRVLTVKPGYVDTPMTAHIKKSPLFASSDRVGRTIYRCIVRGVNGEVYVPWFWRWIMLMLRLLPERIFLRLPI